MELESTANPKLQKVQRRRDRLNRLRRHWLTFAFLMGFVIDNLTLNRVDEVLDNVILATQVVLSMVSITFLYASVAGRLPERMARFGRTYAPMVVQYAFGGLLSGMLIFYGRSGDWLASWPFLLVIILAIFGNELIKDRSSRLIYNVAIMFIGLMSYTVLILPVITGVMGVWIFLASGLIALAVMYGFVQMLFKIIPRFLELQMKAVVFTIGIIYATFNFFYFFNIIPPIPLSLTQLGIYHSVIRFDDNGTYQLKYVDTPWYLPFKNDDSTFYPALTSDVYCFASVFAPTRLDTDIVHVWEYKNADGKWVEHAELGYAINGGIGRGYRGYTQISGYEPGTWRCSVETERGQVLGREVFTIAPRGAQPSRPLITTIE